MGEGNPKAAFNITLHWELGNIFWKIVHGSCSNFDPELEELTRVLFVSSLKKVKYQVIPCAHEQFISKDRALVKLEEDLSSPYSSFSKGIFTYVAMSSIKYLEARRNKLLMDYDLDWRIKRHATCLFTGD